MKLLHYNLIQLCKLLEYPVTEMGCCFGFSAVTSEVIELGEEESFYKKLDTISDYQFNLKILQQKIQDARNKHKQNNSLTIEEIELIEIYKLIKKIAKFQVPHRHCHPTLLQHNLQKIYTYIKTEHYNINSAIFFNRSYLLNKEELNQLFSSFAKILNSKTSLILTSLSHAICVKYDPDKNLWFFYDTDHYNLSNLFNHGSSYYLELNTQEMISNLFCSFDDKDNEFTGFSMIIKFLNGNKQYTQEIETVLNQFPISTFLDRYNAKKQDLMHFLCHTNDLNGVCQLLDQGVLIEEDVNGHTPLYRACEDNHLIIIEEFIKRNIDLKLNTESGKKALFAACKWNNSEIFHKLINLKTVDVNSQSSLGVTFLGAACMHNNVEVVSQLLSFKEIDINKPTNGLSPLSIACYQGNLKIVEMLLERNALIDDSCLITTCLQGHYEVVGKLLSLKEIDINKISNDESALSIACHTGNLKIVNLLLQKGALINDSCLYNACLQGHRQVAAKLLEHNVSCNYIHTSKASPLYAASQNNHVDIVRLLLRKGADRQLGNANGNPPAVIACQLGHKKVLDWLLNNEMVNYRCSSGCTLLYLACQYGHIEIVELLVNEPNIEIDAIGITGHTCLQVACLSPHTTKKKEIFKLLLQHGASLTHKNDQGQTAFDIAMKSANRNWTAIIEISAFCKKNNILINELILKQKYCNKFFNTDKPPNNTEQALLLDQEIKASFS